MNRLTNTLEELKNKSKKALVAYLVAGDPDIETTLELMTVLVESGVDIIEIGVPFTDPIAEGPIIQKAHDRALKNNVSLKSIFEMVDKFKNEVDFSGYEILDIDGVRFSNSKAWGLLRASNTSPKLVMRFEGDTDQELIKIIAFFKDNFKKIYPNLNFEDHN